MRCHRGYRRGSAPRSSGASTRGQTHWQSVFLSLRSLPPFLLLSFISLPQLARTKVGRALSNALSTHKRELLCRGFGNTITAYRMRQSCRASRDDAINLPMMISARPPLGPHEYSKLDNLSPLSVSPASPRSQTSGIDLSPLLASLRRPLRCVWLSQSPGALTRAITMRQALFTAGLLPRCDVRGALNPHQDERENHETSQHKDAAKRPEVSLCLLVACVSCTVLGAATTAAAEPGSRPPWARTARGRDI